MSLKRPINKFIKNNTPVIFCVEQVSGKKVIRRRKVKAHIIVNQYIYR